MMLELTHPLIIAASVMMLIMTGGWFYQYITNNAGVADVLWAFCLSAAAGYYAVVGEGTFALRITIGLLAGIWYARLFWHLYRRVINQKEDGRYQAMRSFWGAKADLHFIWFFAAQAGIAWLFALPFWVIANNSAVFDEIKILALLIAVIAFIGVVIADEQLKRFKSQASTQARTCNVGLWRYSRHPNYFFEWLHWFAYPLLAVGSIYAHWVWLAPCIMLTFLLFFTGIPYSEKQAHKTRGEEYLNYQRTTSAFFPWVPKS